MNPAWDEGKISLRKDKKDTASPPKRLDENLVRKIAPCGTFPPAPSLPLGAKPLEGFYPLALGEKSTTHVTLLLRKHRVRSGGYNKSFPSRMSFSGLLVSCQYSSSGRLVTHS